MKFHHGDLKFLSMLLRGHELEDRPLVFDKGCWTDVDALLNHFKCLPRQTLRRSSDPEGGEGGQEGKDQVARHRHPDATRVKDADTDLFLASRFYSLLDDSQAERMSSVQGVTVLPFNQVPKKLYRRTNERGMSGILQGGMIPGCAKSDWLKNYLSEVHIHDTSYKSGMRSNQPIEVTIDPIQAMEAGCEFFVTETEGVLTRGTIPPSCVISAVDTTKKDLPLYVAKDDTATHPPIPVKGCKVRALDHANPCEGLQSAPRNVSLYLAFVRSTLPIPVKGCKVRMAICHFTSRSCVRPCQSL